MKATTRTTKVKARFDWVVVCIYPAAAQQGFQSGAANGSARGLEAVFGPYTAAQAPKEAKALSISMPGGRVFVPMKANGGA